MDLAYQFKNLLWTLVTVILLMLVSEPVEAFRFGFLSTSPNDVKFYIFTNQSNTDAHNEIVYGKPDTIVACGYDPKKPLILLVHNVLANYKTASDVNLIKNAYLETNMPSNIIMVDYGKLTRSRLPFVLSPLSLLLVIGGHMNTNIVGTRIADFIQFLIKCSVLPGPGHVHIIGFSLGGHIAGVTGRLVNERTGSMISRITGLDLPFQLPSRSLKLTQTNARFVDITYTSFAVIGELANLLGFRQGHAQFYINGGGPHQPNCPNFFPIGEPLCSHSVSTYYFAKSIRKKDIPACKCTRCRNSLLRFFSVRSRQCQDATVYGQYASHSARGNYYVTMY